MLLEPSLVAASIFSLLTGINASSPYILSIFDLSFFVNISNATIFSKTTLTSVKASSNN